MNTQLVFARTNKGNQEITARTYRLPQKLRTVLILVDGRSNLSQLRGKTAGLLQLEQALEDLAMNGFISANSLSWDRRVTSGKPGTYDGEERRQPDAVSAFTAIRARLIDLAILTFGTSANNFVKKFRDAPGSWQGFEAAISDCTVLVAAVFDQRRAEDFRKKCWQVLTKGVRASAESA
jgi:hypothetical protein